MDELARILGAYGQDCHPLLIGELKTGQTVLALTAQ
jgi:hypothetical protein